MAFENDVLDVSLLADGDLSAYQYHFVKMTDENTVGVCSGATDNPIGILQNEPKAAGNVARVRIHGVSRVMAGGAIVAGDKVGTDAAGEGIAKTVSKTEYMGIALVGASATQLATVLVFGYRTISG